MKLHPAEVAFHDETTLIRPVAPPARGWAALGTWFEATTPHGPLRLYLGEAAGPAPHAAAAALALQRADSVLAALDDWLGDDAPDWRWWLGAHDAAHAAAPGAASGSAHGATGTAADTAARDPAVVRLPWRDSTHQLVAPWAWLRALPAPPATLAARWAWPAIEARLCVARLRLAADDLQQLEPGGAVVLPPSLQPGWTGRLRGAGEEPDAGVAVALADPAAPRVLPGCTPPPAAAGAAAGRLCEVRLDLRHAITADHLAGWRGEALADAVAPGLSATLWQRAAGREPARCLGQGHLLPWGDGWALLLQGLGEPVLGHVPGL